MFYTNTQFSQIYYHDNDTVIMLLKEKNIIIPPAVLGFPTEGSPVNILYFNMEISISLETWTDMIFSFETKEFVNILEKMLKPQLRNFKLKKLI